MDIREFNRQAWDRQVEEGNPWTIPASPQEIEAARRGTWAILLTPTIPVPRAWFPPNLTGADVLCLASGGGQQGPILAALGARVTVLDNSPRQLQQDQRVAEREGLSLTLIEGDMRDLSMLAVSSYDLIVHPVSNPFIPDILPVWNEAFRVLRKGGTLLAGFNNPLLYIFDLDDLERGVFTVRHKLPYSDLESITQEERQRNLERGYPLEFSHSLDEQIGGQLAAGFLLTGFFEDRDPTNPLNTYIPGYIATRAVKP
jgi:SAM-dependent methyltransferase